MRGVVAAVLLLAAQTAPLSCSAAAVHCLPFELLWKVTYNSPASSHEVAYDVAIDDSGNIVAVGVETLGVGCMGFDQEWVLRKYDSSGNPLWHGTYAPTCDAGAYCVAIGSEQGIVAGGRDYYDWCARKYSPDGTLAWSRTSKGVANFANGIAIDSSDAIYVPGTCEVGFDDDWLVSRYTGDGTLAWSRTNPARNTQDDFAVGVDVCPDGMVVFCGYTWTTTGATWILRKYTKTGDLLWERYSQHPSGGRDFGQKVAVDDRGAIYMIGTEERADLGQAVNWRIEKYDPDGNRIWFRTYASSGNLWDYPADVAVDRQGNILVVGFCKFDPSVLTGVDSRVENALVRKYDPDGNVLLSMDLKESGVLVGAAYGIAVDQEGNVVVAGYEITPQGNDLAVLKFRDPGCGLRKFEEPVVLYPNPAAGDYVNVAMKLDDDATEVVVEIFNMGMKRVLRGKWEDISRGMGGVTVDGLSELPTGVYLLRARAKLASGEEKKFKPAKFAIKR